MGDPKQDPSPEQQAIDEALADQVNEIADDMAAAVDAAESSEKKPKDDMQTQLREANDRALRVQADLENLRKRAKRELDEGLKYAATPLIRDLLPVLDNLQRAVAAEQGSENSLMQGVQMVIDQLNVTLSQHHCKVIEAEGQPFDPMRHEALLQQPSDEHPAGTVIQVAQTGYQLHDRVIRPAHVIVSQGPAAS